MKGKIPGKKWIVVALGLAALLFLVVRMVGVRGLARRFGSGPRHGGKSGPVEEVIPFDPAAIHPEEWITRYDPARASNGYTLELYHARVPMILDMNGRIVHAWPDVRVRARARLDREGNLLVINTVNEVEEYDWEGNRLWSFALPEKEDFPHHDLIRLRDGNVMLLYRDEGNECDYLLEVDRSGEVVWRWDSNPVVNRLYRDRIAHPNDITHTNSVQELPPNRWFEGGDKRFRPGNLLLSVRNLNTILIIDRETGEVVWDYDEGLDHQHEAVMIREGRPGAGNILVFDNGLENLHRYRRSVVREIVPPEKRVGWEYRSDYFFCSTSGVAQDMPNGNVLITSSNGGRIFEIDRSGQILWEYVPPYEPMRAIRYPYDHCPQLSALGTPRETAVVPAADRPHVDRELYRYDDKKKMRVLEVNGTKRGVVRDTKDCPRLTLPDRPVLSIGYGLDRDRIEAAGWSSPRSVRFTARLRFAGPEAEVVTLIDDTISTDDDTLWIERTIPLYEFGYRDVDFCLEARDETTGDTAWTDGPPFWDWPVIRSEAIPREPQDTLDALTQREKKIRRQQMKALGYVN
jgi:hypothetical protein